MCVIRHLSTIQEVLSIVQTIVSELLLKKYDECLSPWKSKEKRYVLGNYIVKTIKKFPYINRVIDIIVNMSYLGKYKQTINKQLSVLVTQNFASTNNRSVI
jgi:hypothetical protein